MEGSWLEKVRKTIHVYNLYVRIIIKNPKGCTYYYELLNINAKADGWVAVNFKLEAEFTEVDENWSYDSE